MLVDVTDHAADRYRQRVRGTLDAKAEIASRCAHAYAAGRYETGEKGDIIVRDREVRSLRYICRPVDGRLLVITLWEDDDAAARVPRRFTDALRADDAHVADRKPEPR